MRDSTQLRSVHADSLTNTCANKCTVSNSSSRAERVADPHPDGAPHTNSVSAPYTVPEWNPNIRPEPRSDSSSNTTPHTVTDLLAEPATNRVCLPTRSLRKLLGRST